MEIEIRAKIENIENFEAELKKLKNIKIKKQAERQVDTYIKHSADTERKLVFRIRRKGNSAVLTLKTKSTNKKDIMWHDIDIPVSDPDKLEDILMNSDYVYVVLIDKLRDSFNYQDFEINVDNIRDLGYFVEIEFQTPKINEKDLELKLKEMKELLNKLGLSEKDIIERGYVQLMEEKQK